MNKDKWFLIIFKSYRACNKINLIIDRALHIYMILEGRRRKAKEERERKKTHFHEERHLTFLFDFTNPVVYISI